MPRKTDVRKHDMHLSDGRIVSRRKRKRTIGNKLSNYEPLSDEWAEKMKRRGIKIKQPKISRLNNKIMTKRIPQNIINSSKVLAEAPREYSIGIDFEKNENHPQRIINVQGKEDSTIKLNDIEIFGHTHPSSPKVYPSYVDILTMERLKPEFIIASKSGEIIVFNIANPRRYKKWKKENQHNTDQGFFYDFQNKNNRKKFFKETGVRSYPYQKGMLIEMKEDKYYERS